MNSLPTTQILIGDVRDRLRDLPDESIDCVVTSPPYWGLRDYGVAGQIGLEPSLFDWIEEMVSVFREVNRVLKPEGTLWLNLGDSYASNAWGGSLGRVTLAGGRKNLIESKKARSGPRVPDGLKPKDMIGQPWRVAFALQADGWWLRSEIIWHKPSPMPESVKDRPTKSHEQIFLLSKSKHYFYDAASIAEPCTAPEANTEEDWNRAINRRRTVCPGREQETISPDRPSKRSGNKTRKLGGEFAGHTTNPAYGRSFPWEGTSRNARSVWTFPSSPFAEAHFATFPEQLPDRCIRAGASEGGVCSSCGAPRKRRFKKKRTGRRVKAPDGWETGLGSHGTIHPEGRQHGETSEELVWVFSGWVASCKCNAGTVPAVVLDPFFGAGTTGLVAAKLGRSCVGIELSPEYAEMAERRIRNGAGLLTTIEVQKPKCRA